MRSVAFRKSHVLSAAILLLAIAGVIALWRHMNRPLSLINLYLPTGYQLVQVDDREGADPLLSLESGLHTIILSKAGKEYACVIRVSGGGEIYFDLNELYVHPVVTVKYESG